MNISLFEEKPTLDELDFKIELNAKGEFYLHVKKYTTKCHDML